MTSAACSECISKFENKNFNGKVENDVDSAQETIMYFLVFKI